MTEFRTSTEIGSSLRRLLYAARTSPQRWPGGRLTQDQLADRAGCTPTWYRKIENGGTATAATATVCDICQVLGIDPATLRVLGYEDLADVLDVRQELGTQVVVDAEDRKALDEEEQQALDFLLSKMGFSNAWRNKSERTFNREAKRAFI
jgi:transcriptional regulator with XRE-family HTH domain